MDENYNNQPNNGWPQDYNNQYNNGQPQNYNNQYNPQDYSQQYNQQYPQYVEEPEPGKNFAIASLVLGIVSFFCCGFICSIIGLILGIISKNRQPKNNGMATAGIVISIIAIVLEVLGVIIYIATGGIEYYLNF